MDSKNRGEELNQISRLLFDKAANFWYLSIGVEIFAGIFAVALGLISPTGDSRLISAIFAFLVLAFAYYLRLKFDDLYDTAETMRRQSVLTEALNWPLNKTQFSIWRAKAGSNLLRKFRKKSRDANYYATQEPASAKKLLEMTLESAFWTRNLYNKLRTLVQIIFFLAFVLVVLALSIATLKSFPENARFEVAYAIYLLLPLVLSIDLLGWIFKLGRLSKAIEEVEKGLEQWEGAKNVEERNVMRLISEYNCQVGQGFPIHQILFNKWHDEISKLWEER